MWSRSLDRLRSPRTSRRKSLTTNSSRLAALTMFNAANRVFCLDNRGANHAAGPLAPRALTPSCGRLYRAGPGVRVFSIGSQGFCRGSGSRGRRVRMIVMVPEGSTFGTRCVAVPGPVGRLTGSGEQPTESSQRRLIEQIRSLGRSFGRSPTTGSEILLAADGSRHAAPIVASELGYSTGQRAPAASQPTCPPTLPTFAAGPVAEARKREALRRRRSERHSRSAVCLRSDSEF